MYRYLSDAVAYVKKEAGSLTDVSDRIKIILLSAAITVSNNKFKQGYFNSHFLRDITDGDGLFTCVTGCGIGLALGHEMGWPLHIVPLFRHCYLNWKGEFNYDFFGPAYPTGEEKRYKGMGLDAISAGSYLQPLSEKEAEAFYLFTRGIILKDLGRVPEALDAFDHATQLRGGNFPEVHNSRGLALEKLGRREEAREAYLTAIRQNSLCVEPYYRLGIMYEEDGDIEKARANYEHALKNDPEHAGAKERLKKLGSAQP